MTPLQTKWLEALRSGRYEQGQGRLRRGNTFCCLGVGCDVAIKEELVDGTWRVDANYYFFEVVGYLDCSHVLSYELIDLFGIDSDIHDRLISMNDDDERSFAEIADYLEEQWSS